MAEYIEREALRQQIERYVKFARLTNREEAEWVKDECIRQAYVIPTADVVPRAEYEVWKDIAHRETSYVEILKKEVEVLKTKNRLLEEKRANILEIATAFERGKYYGEHEVVEKFKSCKDMSQVRRFCIQLSKDEMEKKDD